MYTQTYNNLGQPIQTQSTYAYSRDSIFQRLQNALVGGQWYLALALAVLSGNRDERKLTNMIFFARHPERKERKLDRSEPNFKQLSAEWSKIRNELVRPYLQKLQAGGQSTPPSSITPSMPINEFDEFLERVLQAHITRSTKRRGSPLRDLKDNQVKEVPGTNIVMRSDAAETAGRLIAAANQALSSAKEVGTPDALRTIRIGATSGYRSSGHQERLWRNYFRDKYYQRTAQTRAQMPGGAHGKAAVRFMITYVSPRIAAPGFSNHQAGLAIDLKQHRVRGREIYNSTTQEAVKRWRNTWFFQWLQANARKFNFFPYEREPWHWAYKPPA